MDLAPFLTGQQAGLPHDTLYWRRQGRAALRSGNWKLLRRSRGARWQLYDLADDVAEARDLASEQPERLQQLRTKWEQLTREMPPKQ